MIGRKRKDFLGHAKERRVDGADVFLHCAASILWRMIFDRLKDAFVKVE